MPMSAPWPLVLVAVSHGVWSCYTWNAWRESGWTDMAGWLLVVGRLVCALVGHERCGRTAGGLVASLRRHFLAGWNSCRW
jgi:hypothetical protein